MEGGWLRPGSRGWWIASGAVFFGLEVLFRLKLGTVFVLFSSWALAHQWLSAAAYCTPVFDSPARRLFFSLYSALVVCAVIFVVLGALNAGLRTFDPGAVFFQLP